MAVKKQQGDLDFEQSSKILNAMMDPRASDPSTPVPGQVWFNTTSDRLKHYDGSTISTVMHLAANDTVTGVFHFSPASGAVPFTVDGGANSVVTNLNADKVDGFNAAQIATGSTAAVRRSDGTLVVADPVNDNESATKGYVDRSRQDRDKKDECHVATTANVDLSSMPAAIDGRTMSVDERFLAKNQTDASENGIYLYKGAASAAVRAPDADEDSEVTAGMTTYIVFGTDHQGAIFTLNTPDPITVGTTDLSFVQTGGQSIYDAGNGMVKSGSRFHFIQDTDYTPGSIVYANGATTMTFLAPAVVGKVLKSGTNPSWAAIDLTADVGTSVLPVGNGGTGTSDQFDQGGVVFAGSNGVYDSDDVFFWNNTSKRLGLGTSSPGGRLHVATGSTGATASTSADELIVECGASGGVSILAPDSSEVQIRLGSPSNNTMALWTSQESIDLVQFGTGSASGKLQLLSGFGEVAATFHSDQSLTLGTTSAPSGSNRFWLYEPTGSAGMLIGSGDGQGATLTLDGRVNGDGVGGDYSTISHQSAGDLRVTNNGAYAIEFVTNSKNVGRFTSDGFLSVGRHGGSWPLDVYNASANNIGRFEHAGNGAEGAHVQIYHNSSSPAVDDVTGSFQFASEDSTGGENVQARIRSVVRQVGTSFVDADLILSCYASGSEVDVLSATHDGRVGINTASPALGDNSDTRVVGTPSLHVYNPGTSGKYACVARFEAGGDADDTGAAIRLNHGNDRGLQVLAGRATGDNEFVAFSTVGSGGGATDFLTANGTGVGIMNSAPTEALDITGNLKLSGILKHANKWRTQTVSLSAPASSGSAGKWCIRLQSTSQASLVSGRITLTGSWDHANLSGQLVAEFGYHCLGSGLNSGVNYFRVVSATGSAASSSRIEAIEEENGYISIPIWASNKISPQVRIDYWESVSGALDNISQTAFSSGTIPDYSAPSFRGILVDTVVAKVTRGDSTAYSQVAPSVDDCFLALSNVLGAEAANLQSQIQFNINGGTYNRVGSFGMISKSASNRHSHFVWCLDDGSSRPERMRLSSDGDLGVGTTSPLYRLDVRDDFGGDHLVGRFCNADAAGGVVVQMDRTGEHRASSIQFSREGTPDWYMGVLRWGGSNTSRFAVSSSSDMAVTEPQFCISGDNVGIGDVNPSMRLNVKGGSNVTTAIGFENTATDNKWRVHAHYADQTLRFRADTFTTDILVLDDTGLVGINGTPSVALDVNGSGFTQISATNTNTAQSAGIIATNDDGSGSIRIECAGSTSAIAGLAQGAGIVMSETTLQLAVNNTRTAALFIASDGDVGIGTGTPDSKLEVSGAGPTQIKVTNTTDSVEGVLLSQETSVWIGAQSDHDVKFGTNYTGNSILNTSGDWGFGIMTPTARVHIEGGTTSGDTLLKLGDRISVTGDGAFKFGSAAAHGKLSWDSGKAIFGAIGSNDIEIQTGAVSRLSINSSDGAVKIGSGGSLYQLEVANSTSFGGTGSCKINASLNNSGVGLFVDANTRQTSEGAVSLISTRDRLGNYPFTVTVGGDINLANLTASKALFLDSNKNIVSNGTTDLIDEGSTNLYHTTSRAQSAISSASSLEISYSSGSIGLGTEAGRVKSGTIGDDVATEHVFTHNLGTRAVATTVFRTASPYDEVDVPIEHTSTNTVTVKPNHVYNQDEYTIVCVAANG